MDKRGKTWVWIVFVLVLGLVVVGIFLFITLSGRDYREDYGEGGRVLKNPASGLSLEEAVEQFDEDFVYYLLVSIEAYNLHNPPLSKNKPKIEMYIGDDIYNAFIEEGKIKVDRGVLSKKDIIIRTSKEEAVKMVKDRNYVFVSFNEGKSSVELVSGKTELFTKGYLNIYSKLTGKSVTGGVIRDIFD